jgi:hypothetical protein
MTIVPESPQHIGREQAAPTVVHRCPIHNRLLICPACIGAAGGRVVTPAKLRALRKARRALREKRRRSP